MRCGDYGHISKQTGLPCRRRCVPGRNACKFHGGNTLKGIAHPNYKHGKYAKDPYPDLPDRLREGYEAAQNDPDLLALRNELALLRTRLNDLLARVDSGESGQLWKTLLDKKRELLAAQRSTDTAAQSQLINDILRLIDRGHLDYAAWREVGQVIEQYRKVAEAEHKRVMAIGAMIKAEEALELARALLEAVRIAVPDRSQRAEVQRQFDLIVKGGKYALPAGAETEGD